MDQIKQSTSNLEVPQISNFSGMSDIFNLSLPINIRPCDYDLRTVGTGYPTISCCRDSKQQIPVTS